MIRPLALTLTLLTTFLFAAPMAQAAQTYICRIEPRGNSGWIPEVLFVGRQDGAETAIVSDPLILYFNDSTPVEARVVADNPRRVTFAWSIRAATGPDQYISRFQYTATYIKSSGKMMIAASPLGYTSRFSGDGTCKVERR